MMPHDVTQADREAAGGKRVSAKAALENAMQRYPRTMAHLSGLARPVHHDGENWDEVQAMLATLRKEALG